MHPPTPHFALLQESSPPPDLSSQVAEASTALLDDAAKTENPQDWFEALYRRIQLFECSPNLITADDSMVFCSRWSVWLFLGSLLFLVAAVVLLVWCLARRKRRQPGDPWASPTPTRRTSLFDEKSHEEKRAYLLPSIWPKGTYRNGYEVLSGSP